MTALLAAPAGYLSFTVVPMNFALVALLLSAGGISAALRVPDWVLPTVLGGATIGLAFGIVLAIGPGQESAGIGFGLAATVTALLVVTLKLGEILGHAITSGSRA